MDIMDNNSDIGIPDDLISQLSVTYTTGQPLFNRDVFFPITFQPDNSMYGCLWPSPRLVLLTCGRDIFWLSHAISFS